MDLTGYLRRIMNVGAAETFDPATDSLEAIANALGIGPSVGLWMFGVCDPAMVASQTAIFTNNLTGLPDDIFNDQFWVQVILNHDAPGTAPEGEFRRITNFVAATQAFTTDAFSANVEANDLLCIVHESLLSHEILGVGTLTASSATVPADNGRAEADNYFVGCLLMPTEGVCRFQPRLIVDYTAAGGIFILDSGNPFTAAPGLVDYVVLKGPGHVSGSLIEANGTLTTDGTEQDVYLNNAPGALFKPLTVQIDMTNMAAADVVRVRTYYRIAPAGNLRMKDEVVFNGVQALALKNVELEPNLYGIRVSMERTGGADHAYDWAVFVQN